MYNTYYVDRLRTNSALKLYDGFLRCNIDFRSLLCIGDKNKIMITADDKYLHIIYMYIYTDK